MVRHKAHVVADRPRTLDIHIDNDFDFSSMLLPDQILKGLHKSGYKKPSPIQKQALPLVRCGMDLIVQAKAGTGKTCVFALAALEMVKPHLPHLQAVILAPTREIALQIKDVISTIGKYIKGLKTSCFIGGCPLELDKEKARTCHIAVGTPGRMQHLMSQGLLNTEHTRLLVLDEADKLMESIFKKDINLMFSMVPESKQVLALSATYTPEMVEFLRRYMHGGQYVTPQSGITASSTLLLGVRQFTSLLPHHVNKLASLNLKDQRLQHLLASIPFNQCLIFSNLHSRAQSVCEVLNKKGWAVKWIAGRQTQEDRTTAITHLKEQKVQVLVTTDLTARGIDVDNVNLVINLDLPLSHETYLHRMGRSGRYGSHGMVITIISRGEELEAFQKLLGNIGGASLAVNVVPDDLHNVDLWRIPDSDLEKVHGILEEKQECKASSSSSEEEEEEPRKREEEEPATNNDHFPVGDNAAENGCNCGLFEIQSDQIEVVSLPSLFSVQEKQPNWREMLPVVINEFRVPLNTAITLLGSKVIRVKVLEEKIGETSKSDDFLSKETLQIDLESCLRNPSSALSYDEIEEALKGEVSESKYDVHIKTEKFIYQKEVEQALKRFQVDKKKVETALSVFDSFDVVGWMAVDAHENYSDSLKLDKNDVYKFDLVKCPSGKNHINVLRGSEVKPDKEDNCCVNISTLKLNKFNLTTPVSLKSVAECLTSLGKERVYKSSKTPANKSKTSPNIANPKLHLEDKENYPERHKSKLNSSINETLENGCPKICVDEMYCNGFYDKSKENNTEFKPLKYVFSEKNSDQNCNNKPNTKIHQRNSQKTKKAHAPKVKHSSVKSTEYLSQSSSSESGKCSSKCFPNLLEDHMKSKDKVSSSEESEPYVNMSKKVLNVKKIDYEKSCSDTTSDAEKYSASDTTISDSEVSQPRMSKGVTETNSSSECSYELTNEKPSKDCCIKLKRNCKNKNKNHHIIKHTAVHNVSSESYSSSMTEESHCQSFLTACTESSVPESPLPDPSNYCKSFQKYSFGQPSCSRTSKQNYSSKNRQQAPKSKSADFKNLFSKKNQQKGEVDNDQSASSVPHNRCQYGTSHRTNNQKYPNLKILTSDNLFEDWYSTWYSQVRQRAQHLAYLEYMKTMVSRP